MAAVSFIFLKYPPHTLGMLLSDDFVTIWVEDEAKEIGLSVISLLNLEIHTTTTSEVITTANICRK